MADIRSYIVDISIATLTDLKQRLDNTRWPEAEATGDWNQGIPLVFTREIVKYWAQEYDMTRLATRLNAHPNYVTEIDGLDIHFLHIRSSHADAQPLILTHGWPGSVVEFLNVIGSLTEPQLHDAEEAQAYHLVIPSLPGFGFSGKPSKTGWGTSKTANAWAKLMARLGYERYFAQGGDWGAVVTSLIGIVDPDHCRAIHLNMVMSPPDPSAKDLTVLEISALEGLKHYQDWDSGYSKQQSTRPQTLGYALTDSPAGQAAWIMEKFWAWTDCKGDPRNVISLDEMLDNVMVYWVNAAAASSARMYWESFNSGFGGEQVKVPMGGTIFPKEIFRTSERFAKNVYPNIIYWSQRSQGGHFAAFEQPDVYVEEVRACFSKATL